MKSVFLGARYNNYEVKVTLTDEGIFQYTTVRGDQYQPPKVATEYQLGVFEKMYVDQQAKGYKFNG